MKLFILSTIFVIFFSGCIERYPYEEDCYKPIYLSYEKLRADYPSVKKPREIENAGKIYIYGDILLINEKNKGIHVVDNRVKETPIRKYFIEIPGNIDIAVKDDYLYADSFTDLVVLNIKDIDNIKVVHRKEKIFPYDYDQALKKKDYDKKRCYPDESRGVVIGYK